MKLYFDTSAFVKLLHNEEGTVSVTKLFEDKSNEIWISELAKVEIVSALCRRVRSREITKERMEFALSFCDSIIASINCEPMGYSTLREAESQLKRFCSSNGLRTLDALQLAAFSLIAEDDWVFVSADSNLCTVAGLMEYRIINPLES